MDCFVRDVISGRKRSGEMEPPVFGETNKRPKFNDDSEQQKSLQTLDMSISDICQAYMREGLLLMMSDPFWWPG